VEGRTHISSFPRDTVPESDDADLIFVNKSISDGAKSNGDKAKLLQMELHTCELKNRAIPRVPKFPSPYS